MKQVKYIIRKRALGDVLWIEPVIRALSKKYKQLIVHTKYNELFENYPISNVSFKNELSFLEKIIIRLEEKSRINFFTLSLENAYEKLPNLHFLHAYQQKASLPITDEYPKIFLSDKEKDDKIIDEKYVVLHLESFSEKKYRQIYGVDWPQVVTYLNNKGFKVVQIGVNTSNIEGTMVLKTTLRQLLSLIYNSNYFIGLDSGPSHIAASLGIPSLIFFGAINPLLRHFPDFFNGILIKQHCEYDGYAVKDREILPCTLADESGNPKCCTYTTKNIISKIEELLKKNVSKVHQ